MLAALCVCVSVCACVSVCTHTGVLSKAFKKISDGKTITNGFDLFPSLLIMSLEV